MTTPTQYAANAVRAELARQRKTQGDLAGKLGVTPGTVSRRMNAESDFSVSDLVAISAWLGVPIETFIQPVNSSQCGSAA
ncbi:helix-turn-helix transcriptional regulator [Nocardioides sp.]|uniref:helix-turn-helix domain-containing protein n=1 Tax=Nocardioides sp. TaxID=35761 RepID=UPI00260C651E|nr:helix-turn-helix transcriptional regulator [Nocardioides sp.]